MAYNSIICCMLTQTSGLVKWATEFYSNHSFHLCTVTFIKHWLQCRI